MSIHTPITQLFGMRYPILLAGMGLCSTPSMAAEVSNAGGLGVVGGVGYTPEMLKEMLIELKAQLDSPELPFGVDLLIPQVGGNARKTNYDYTKGALDTLIDIVIEQGAKLFVSAVGVPPRSVVENLHNHNILVMNMVGHPKHVSKAIAAGVDLICAQGGEGGGHTGEEPTSVLIPAIATLLKQSKYTSPLTGQPVQLVAAGGIYDGRGLASSLMLGASAVWIGTRFVTAKESGATEDAKNRIIEAGFDSTIKSTIWTGRPLRAIKTPYIEEWETKRRSELEELQKKGILAWDHELDRLDSEGKLTDEIMDEGAMRPAGVVAALVNKPNQGARSIVEEIAKEAYQLLKGAGDSVDNKAKL